MSSSPRRGPKGDSGNSRNRTAQDNDRLRLVSIAEQRASATHPSAPVFQFRHFRVAIAGLQLAGALPHRIDGSVWSNRHFDAVDNDLLPAFHFLGLIDEARRPLPLLADLVASFGTPAWPQNLQRMLEGAYSDILSSGVEQASPKYLLGMFRKRFGLNPVQARTATGFFVHAARESQLDVGPLLATSQRSISASSTAQAARERMTKMLLSHLPPFNDGWSDDLKLAWLTAFRDVVDLP